MMRLGEAAENLGVTADTLVNWIKRFADYFSDEAKGDVGKQRTITTVDLFILNTIRVESPNWERAFARLREGDVDKQLPDTALTAKRGMTPVQVYTDSLARRQEVDTLHSEIVRLTEKIESLEASHQREREQLIRELAEANTMLKLYESGRLKPSE